MDLRALASIMEKYDNTCGAMIVPEGYFMFLKYFAFYLVMFLKAILNIKAF